LWSIEWQFGQIGIKSVIGLSVEAAISLIKFFGKNYSFNTV